MRAWWGILILGLNGCDDGSGTPMDAALDMSPDAAQSMDAQDLADMQNLADMQDLADMRVIDAHIIDLGPDAQRPDAGPPDAGDLPVCEGNEFEQRLRGLPADTWYEAPNSHMRGVCILDEVGVRGVSGCPAIITAWGGGAYDNTRNLMLIWGGGHGDYYGNEMYAFNVVVGAWLRLTDPSVGDVTDNDPLPDGQPASRHTYDGLEVIPGMDWLFAHGGSRAGDGFATNVTWTYDFAAATWINREPATAGPGGYSGASAYDPQTQQVLFRSTQNLHAYDVGTNDWMRLKNFGFPPDWPRYEQGGDKTAAIDPVRRLFWAVGGRSILIWDLDAAAIVTDAWITIGGGDYTNAEQVGDREEQLFESGGGDIYTADAPGFAYDPVADEMVAWANEGGPYRLNLETRTWSQGSSQGAPVSQNSGGTFGRWRYIPDYNVFILINSIDENVYFYKNRASHCRLP